MLLIQREEKDEALPSCAAAAAVLPGVHWQRDAVLLVSLGIASPDALLNNFYLKETWRLYGHEHYWRGERRTLSWEQHQYLTSSPLTISLFSSYMHKYRSVIYVPLHTLVYIIHSAVYISVIAERGCNVQRLNVSRYSDSCPRTSPVQPGETNKLLHEQKAGQDFTGSPNYKWRACSWHVKLLSALCNTAQVPTPPRHHQSNNPAIFLQWPRGLT